MIELQQPMKPARADCGLRNANCELNESSSIRNPQSAIRNPLVLILVTGALLRLGLWAWFANEPIHIWDEKDYNPLAINLVEHGEFAFTPGTPTSLRPPLYPALVAGVYRLFGLENFAAV